MAGRLNWVCTPVRAAEFTGAEGRAADLHTSRGTALSSAGQTLAGCGEDSFKVAITVRVRWAKKERERAADATRMRPASTQRLPKRILLMASAFRTPRSLEYPYHLYESCTRASASSGGPALNRLARPFFGALVLAISTQQYYLTTVVQHSCLTSRA